MKMSMAIKRFVANKMKDIQSGISLRKILTYYYSNHLGRFFHYRRSASCRLSTKDRKAR